MSYKWLILSWLMIAGIVPLAIISGLRAQKIRKGGGFNYVR